MSYNLLALLDDDKVPFLGLNTDIEPTMLPDGMVQRSENWRSDRGIIRVRDGIGNSAFSAGPTVSNGTVIGFQVLNTPDGDFAVMCMVDPAPAPDRVRVFVAPYTGTVGSWTEKTATTGQFGDSRPVVPTQGYCQIEGLHGGFGFSSAVPACVVQNGIDNPLYVPLSAVAGDARFIYDVDYPRIATGHAPRARGGGAEAQMSAATRTDSGGANPFSGTGELVIVDATGVDAGETMTFVFGAPLDFSAGYQMWLPCRYTSDPWAYLQVEIRTGAATWTTIYDPDNDSDGLTTIDMTATGIDLNATLAADGANRLVAFQVGGVVADLTDIQGIRFTASSAIPASEFVMRILMLKESGMVPGKAQYAITNFSRWTEAESPPKVMALFESEMDRSDRVPSAARQFVDEDQAGYASGETISIGGQWGTVTIPVSNELYYTYLVPIFTPLETEGDKAVDQCCIYRRDPGYTEYLHVASVTTVIYSSSWEPNNSTSSFTLWQQRKFYTDNTPTEDRSLKRKAPDSYIRAIPKGLAMLNCNGRLHVGTVKTSTSPARVMVSEIDTAHRFRDLPRRQNQSFDASSGFVISTENQQVMALRAMTSSSLGIYSVFAATARKVLKLEYQYEPMAVVQAEVGTLSPNAFTAKDGILYFITPERELMALGADLASLSEDRVGSILAAIPDAVLKYCTLALWRGRLYLSHSLTGQTLSLRSLVYNAKRDIFESDDTFPSASCPQILCVADSSGGTKLLFADQEGSLWEYEKSASLTDGGTAISPVLRTKEYMGESFATVMTRRMLIVGGVTGVSATVTTQRYHVNPDSTVSASIGTATTGGTQKYDEDAVTGRPVGGLSQKVSFGISGSIPGGWRVQEIHAEICGTLAGATTG